MDCGGFLRNEQQLLAVNLSFVGPTVLSISVVPVGCDLGCNPATASLPTDASIKARVSAANSCGGAVTITVSHVDTTSGCVTTRTFTITAADGSGDHASASMVFYMDDGQHHQPDDDGRCRDGR